jgi:atypical dual specificity phosphatase
VFASAPWEECAWRISKREDHPTVKKGGGARMMAALKNTLEPPTLDEGFSRIIEFASIAQCNAELQRLGAEPPPPPSFEGHHIIKFPRTKHVVNLGAATRDDLVLSKAEQASLCYIFACMVSLPVL